MGEDSNHSVMSDSQDATDFSNKINPSTAGPTPTSKVDPNAIAKEWNKICNILKEILNIIIVFYTLSI